MTDLVFTITKKSNKRTQKTCHKESEDLDSLLISIGDDPIRSYLSCKKVKLTDSEVRSSESEKNCKTTDSCDFSDTLSIGEMIPDINYSANNKAKDVDISQLLGLDDTYSGRMFAQHKTSKKVTKIKSDDKEYKKSDLNDAVDFVLDMRSEPIIQRARKGKKATERVTETAPKVENSLEFETPKLVRPTPVRPT